MKLNNLFELSGTENFLTFRDTPEVTLTLSDGEGRQHRLGLRNRKKADALNMKYSRWCNGWTLNEKILQTEPDRKVLSDRLEVFKVLDLASSLLNQKYFPELDFPQYAKHEITDVKSLESVLRSFEEYNSAILSSTSSKLSESDKEYLLQISLQQLICALNCHELTDKFKVTEKNKSESKLLHSFNYEYFLNHEGKYEFPLKKSYSSHYTVGLSFQLFSDKDLSVNDTIDARLKFDYIKLENSYVINYRGTDKRTQTNISSADRQGTEDSRCFIVTAVTGDVNHPIVNEYRFFRDHHLSRSRLGNSIIQKYYEFSPPIADFIKRSMIARLILFHILIRPAYFILELFHNLSRTTGLRTSKKSKS